MSSFDHPYVQERQDRQRGCGWRHEGTYLVGEGVWVACGRLPIPLDFCPCCGQKVTGAQSVIPGYGALNLTRGWTWIDGAILRAQAPECRTAKPKTCGRCLINRLQRAGLMWVGAGFYKTPDSFVREALVQGVSKRIGRRLPKGFVVGQTAVALAHRRVISHPVKNLETGQVSVHWTPGIFGLFVPQQVEYVLSGDETDAFVEGLVEQGITPVHVTQIRDRQPALLPEPSVN